jgi:23S rRNA (guanosine2251-2'-O)-methyltransferase
MVQPVIILDNLRSAANVGSVLRTCDAAGIKQVVACGITPYPPPPHDPRDPATLGRIERSIAKTALGAERTVQVEYISDTLTAINHCRGQGRTIYGLELAPQAVNLFNVQPRAPWVLVVGNEVVGLPPGVLGACDQVLQIPQVGSKESLNVAVATGIAVYALIQQPES